MPAKFEDDLIWVAADTPLSDSAFLSSKIKDLCGDLPIFWLRPTYSSSKPSASLCWRYENVQNKSKIVHFQGLWEFSSIAKGIWVKRSH